MQFPPNLIQIIACSPSHRSSISIPKANQDLSKIVRRKGLIVERTKDSELSNSSMVESKKEYYCGRMRLSREEFGKQVSLCAVHACMNLEFGRGVRRVSKEWKDALPIDDRDRWVWKPSMQIAPKISTRLNTIKRKKIPPFSFLPLCIQTQWCVIEKGLDRPPSPYALRNHQFRGCSKQTHAPVQLPHLPFLPSSLETFPFPFPFCLASSRSPIVDIRHDADTLCPKPKRGIVIDFVPSKPTWMVTGCMNPFNKRAQSVQSYYRCAKPNPIPE